jgi:hypothetical protein
MSDLTTKEETITTLKNKDSEYSKTIEILTKEKEELNAKIHFMNQGMKYDCFVKLNKYKTIV